MNKYVRSPKMRAIVRFVSEKKIPKVEQKCMFFFLYTASYGSGIGVTALFSKYLEKKSIIHQIKTFWLMLNIFSNFFSVVEKYCKFPFHIFLSLKIENKVKFTLK